MAKKKKTRISKLSSTKVNKKLALVLIVLSVAVGTFLVYRSFAGTAPLVYTSFDSNENSDLYGSTYYNSVLADGSADSVIASSLSTKKTDDVDNRSGSYGVQSPNNKYTVWSENIYTQAYGHTGLIKIKDMSVGNKDANSVKSYQLPNEEVENTYAAIAWYQDSSKVLFVTQKGGAENSPLKLRTLDLATGTFGQLVDNLSYLEGPYGFIVLGDNKTIVGEFTNGIKVLKAGSFTTLNSKACSRLEARPGTSQQFSYQCQGNSYTDLYSQSVTGSPKLLYTTPKVVGKIQEGGLTDHTWSPDGKKIAMLLSVDLWLDDYGCNIMTARRVSTIDATGANLNILTTTSAKNLSGCKGGIIESPAYIAFSPDNSHIAFIESFWFYSSNEKDKLHVFPVSDPKNEKVIEKDRIQSLSW